MEATVFEVSQINCYIKDKLDNDAFLAGLYIRGELSNYKRYPSGHHYFTIKDSESALRCVMFRGSASVLRFQPENGMKVIVFGRISVFSRDGAYQLYCQNMIPDGVGDLAVAFEQLKRKLEQEGLFEDETKKPLPRFPHRIAIITSSAGAAIHDMLRILSKRYPLSEVILLPVRVQGEQAPAEIAAAIRYANLFSLADVIITGRGGGSLEDLWAFNDEGVARAIYQSQIPVVSAVGHEPDVTISDFVADLRAATPSNAAELVAPDQEELLSQLASLLDRLQAAMEKKLALSRQRLQTLAQSRMLQHPINYIHEKQLVLDYTHERLVSAARRQLDNRRQRFIRLTTMLDALSPLKVLGRGYGMLQQPDGSLVRSCAETAPGQLLVLRLSDGRLWTRVEKIEEDAL